MSYLSRHRPICTVLQEIKQEADKRGLDHIMKLCDEATDYAQRMSARLMEYKRREEPYWIRLKRWWSEL